MFATANIACCKPVGIPSISTREALWPLKRSFEKDRRQSSFLRQRCTVIITADSTCAITLAIATPSAAIWHFMTKNRLSITFSMPDTVRYSSGLFVSPAALSTPLPKLYTAIAGRPSA